MIEDNKSWKGIKLGDVLYYEQPTKYIVSSDQYNDKFSMPVLTAGKSFILGYTDELVGVYSSLPAIIFDDFTTEAKYVDFEFKVKSSAMKILTADKDIADLRFMFYLLSTIKLDTALHKRYWISKFAELEVFVPPLPTQRHIAKIIDQADTLRKKDKQLLLYYDDLAQSLFNEMFGDPVKNEKKWQIRKLGSVCSKITDGTHFSPPNQITGVPYITAKHVRKNYVDFYSNPTYITQEDHEAIYSRCTPVEGDVLYIKDGATTGIAAINNYDFQFSMLSSLALIKVNKQFLNNYFLCHWLNNEQIKADYIRNYMAGAAIRRFTLDKIKKFEILIPPIALQNKFAQQVQNIEQQKEKVKAQIQESENLFQKLLQQAFNGSLN